MTQEVQLYVSMYDSYFWYRKSTDDHSAFTQIEIQRLLRGVNEPLTSGFGTGNIWVKNKPVRQFGYDKLLM